MTVQEVSRALARVEQSVRESARTTSAQIDGLTQAVGGLRSDMQTTRATLDLREQHQTERTQGRDRQIAAINARQDETDKLLDELRRQWWTLVGRMAGIAAASTILGTGAATAVARLFG